MLIAQAKQISLVDYMSKIGSKVIISRQNGNDLWYLSPIRNESYPSFHINVERNVFFDCATGEGGNDVINLARYCLKNASVSEALQHLDSMFVVGGYTPIVFNKSKIYNNHNDIQNVYIKDMDLHFDWHFQYLKLRKISNEIGKYYLRNVKFKNVTTDKIRYALGFKNNKGGWELRHFMEKDNAYQKSSIQPKSMTFIKGNDSSIIDIFEGFSDFLPYQSNYGNGNILPQNSTIILNSLSFHKQARELIEKRLLNENMFESKIIEVRTFFDNHKPGYDAHNYFVPLSNLCKVTAMNNMYNTSEDLGQYIMDNF